MAVFTPPLPVSEYIPHRGKMSFLDYIIECDSNSCITEMEIKEENIFLFENRLLDPVLFIELIAQTAATLSGYSNPDIRKSGFLVGVTDFSTLRDIDLSPGSKIKTRINREAEFNNFGFFSGEVFMGKKLYARANIRVWEQESETTPADSAAPFPSDPVQKKIFLKDEILNSLLSFKKEKNSINADFSLTEDFTGFNGHFPGNPVLPGVMALKIGQSILEKAIDTPLILKYVSRIKFPKTIENDEKISLRLVYTLEEDIYLVDIRLVSNNELCSSIHCTFEKRG